METPVHPAAVRRNFSHAYLLAERAGAEANPFLTIAIPQYNRRRYLEVNLASIFAQNYKDFEILVSDDASSDDSNQVIPALLDQSHRLYRYYAQPTNLGYDGNVRFCLGAALGKYVMILGNDDSLVTSDNLEKIASALQELDCPEVAITNYQDWESGDISRRAYGTLILGSGPWKAAHYFRSFSFTSGLIYKTTEASRHETDKWDTSIYYQIYLACRIMAAGGRMAGLDISAVRDHIRLNGELFPGTYRVKYKNAPWSFKWKHTGLDSVARVTIDAILPFVEPSSQSKLIKTVWKQLLLITYPYWVLEYRRLANWGWGFGIARDLWPGNRLREYQLSFIHRVYLWLLYSCITVAALLIPPSLFTLVRHRLAEFIRQRRQQRNRT